MLFATGWVNRIFFSTGDSIRENLFAVFNF